MKPRNTTQRSDCSIHELERFLESGEEVTLLFESDMTLDGRYEPETVVVTNNRLFVLCRDAEDVCRELPLGQVALLKSKMYMGNGVLLVTTWGANIELVRYSSSLAEQAEQFVKALESYLISRTIWQNGTDNESKVEHKDDEKSAEASNRAKRCPQCGRLLPPDRDICQSCVSKKAIVVRTLRYLKPYKRMLALTLLLTFIVAGLAVARPRLSQILMDDAILGNNLALLKLVVAALAGLFITGAVLSSIRGFLTTKLAENVCLDLRNDVYAHLQRLSLDYHDKQSTGRLISRVTTDTERLQTFAVSGLQQILVDVFVLTLVLAWMFMFSAKLTLILWLPVPLLFFVFKWYHRTVRPLYKKTWRRWAGLSAHLSDTIPGVALVQGFSQEQREIGEFETKNDRYRSQYLSTVLTDAKFNAAVILLIQFGTVLAYWFGGRATIGGALGGKAMTIGELVMFMGWMAQMYMPVQRFSMLSRSFEHAISSAERVFDVLDTEPTTSANEDGAVIEKIEGEIIFDNVSFAYEGGTNALERINFSVKAGETVGVVGPSGAGKSTLTKLLCRFYNPTKGTIWVGGEDLTSLNLASYRKQLGIVSQSPFLFHDTVMENIRYGKPDASLDEVIEAATLANCHEFIMEMPEAYDTDCRERGTRLSGGQQQRICIARAILKNPGILILDEATSSVDTKNEELIQEALDRLTENRTTFIIAHRLSTLRKADKILVIDKGKLLDCGSHEELVHRCKLYMELVEAQTKLSAAMQKQKVA